MTEASSFHLLLCPPQISRTLLVLVSYGNSCFCSFAFVRVTFSPHFLLSSLVSLPTLISEIPFTATTLISWMDTGGWYGQTHSTQQVRADCQQASKTWFSSPSWPPGNAQHPEGQTPPAWKAGQCFPRLHEWGGKAVLQCNQRAATSQLQTVTF